MKVWNPTEVSFRHPQAGGIKPGLNVLDIDMATRCINDGAVEPYTNQDKKELPAYKSNKNKKRSILDSEA